MYSLFHEERLAVSCLFYALCFDILSDIANPRGDGHGNNYLLTFLKRPSYLVLAFCTCKRLIFCTQGSVLRPGISSRIHWKERIAWQRERTEVVMGKVWPEIRVQGRAQSSVTHLSCRDLHFTPTSATLPTQDMDGGSRFSPSVLVLPVGFACGVIFPFRT